MSATGGGGVAHGEDGRPRCAWCLGHPESVAYHDDVWGRPERDERRLFEMLTLELFQSGLSWLTILRKREGFRSAFADWDPGRIAAYGDADVERLLGDAAIVRHRGKIEATVANARALTARRAEGETLAGLVWSFAPPAAGRPAPRELADLPSRTAESTAMAAALRGRGFRHVGPITAYSLMQAAGLVDDHLAGCFARGAGPRNA